MSDQFNPATLAGKSIASVKLAVRKELEKNKNPAAFAVTIAEQIVSNEAEGLALQDAMIRSCEIMGLEAFRGAFADANVIPKAMLPREGASEGKAVTKKLAAELGLSESACFRKGKRISTRLARTIARNKMTVAQYRSVIVRAAEEPTIKLSDARSIRELRALLATVGTNHSAKGSADAKAEGKAKGASKGASEGASEGEEASVHPTVRDADDRDREMLTKLRTSVCNSVAAEPFDIQWEFWNGAAKLLGALKDAREAAEQDDAETKGKASA